MEIIAKSKINHKDNYFCRDIVNLDIVGKLSQVTHTDIEKNYFGLMRLLKGEEIYVILENPTHIIGRTNEKQLVDIWSKMDIEEKKEYFGLDERNESELFEEILNEFGDGKRGFFVDVQTPQKEIVEALREFETSIR